VVIADALGVAIMASTSRSCASLRWSGRWAISGHRGATSCAA
jgi:hypothetical protein